MTTFYDATAGSFARILGAVSGFMENSKKGSGSFFAGLIYRATGIGCG
jgi:hypothetical protein